MSDWLQETLTRHLSPAMAPEELGVRLGFARAKRCAFPRTAFAVAAAVVVMMAGGLAASREARNGEVEFVAADPGAISVWLGHQTNGGAERTSNPATDAGCKTCHRL